jgi:hypothetical protein
MGGGRGMFTLIDTCAIAGTETAVINAKSIVPKSNFFKFVASIILFLCVCWQTDVQGIASKRSTSISFPQTSQEPNSPSSILASALFMAWMSFCSLSSNVARTSAIGSFCAVSSDSTSCPDKISRASSLSLWASKT